MLLFYFLTYLFLIAYIKLGSEFGLSKGKPHIFQGTC